MNSHYLNRYHKFIESCRFSDREKVHVHHILPRSMNGSDEDYNKIKLSVREHFISHWLLAKGFDNGACWSAFRIMCLRFKDASRVTSKMYELSEQKRIEKCVGLMKDKVWADDRWMSTEEYRNGNWNHISKNKVSVVDTTTGKNKRILKKDFDNTKHISIKSGKVNVYFLDGTSGEISKSEFHKNRNLYRTHNEGLVTVYNIETNDVIQVSKQEYCLYKNIKYRHTTSGLKMKCPYCKKIVGTKRWHFENCREKEK